MKKAEWQAVYAPRGDALERRVRRTLDGLEEKNRYAYPKRGAFIAAALVLALITAAAVAAGLTRSAGYDAKRLAHRALEEKYGFTQDMDSYFLCTVEKRNGQTVVTYRANEDVGDFAWKLGDYTVTIQDGQAAAGWSGDGEAVGSDFSSDVWDTALLARGIARRRAGEEWYEITGTALKTGEDLSDAGQNSTNPPSTSAEPVLPESGMLTEQDALALARQVLESDGGLSADVLNDPESEMYAVCTQEDGRTVWTVWHHNAVGICAVAIDAADGTILDMIIDTGMAGNG